MIRVALPIIGGRTWTGGYNYLLNLVAVTQKYAPGRIAPVVLFGPDSSAEERAPFADMPGVEVVVDPAFARSGRSRGLAESILLGVDSAAQGAFRRHRIDVVFEAARYYGWRCSIPALAWIPDFQHEYLKHLFSPAARLRRWIGFTLQILSGRLIMLSSEDARADCERFHPISAGRTRVVRFAVPRETPVDVQAAASATKRYGLEGEFFFLPNQFSLHKNHERVIEALGRLRAQGRAVTVAASGQQLDPRDPERYARLLARAEELGVQDMFRPLGLIPYADIAMLMRASTALLNPSLFEGWSTTVEEAKATGTPMLLSDLGVHREQAGDTAVYFDPRDADDLARAMGSFRAIPDADRREMAHAGADRSREAARTFANEFTTLISEAVSRRDV